MELTTADVARETGLTIQQVSAALRAGALQPTRKIGRSRLMDVLALQAFQRSRSRGRRWNDATYEAAMDLLSGEATVHLAGSQLSRLRGHLRQMSARELAYAAGGLGGVWARYRCREAATITAERLGPSAISGKELGLVGAGGFVTFVRVDDLDDFELSNDVVVDVDGNLGVIERSADSRRARVLLDTYLLGSARESAAAERLLAEARDAL